MGDPGVTGPTGPATIAGPEQVTPGWLTSVLRGKGHLLQGSVASVREVDRRLSIHTWFAALSFLEVCYAVPVPPSTPRRLVLKVAKPGLEPDELAYGGREVTFYTTFAPIMHDPPLARCYDAAYDRGTGSSHLLLEDLSSTHAQLEPPLPPSHPQCEGLVEALADVHAFWWEHPQALAEIGDHTGVEILNLPYTMDETEQIWSAFVDHVGDRLSLARRRTYERVLSSWPPSGLLGRLDRRRCLTLVHGDAHAWNALYPLHPAHNRVRLIDWHEWGVNVGTNDLAEMISLWWYPGRRARLERFLLQRYHKRLLARGVPSYDWATCWDDYRRSVIRLLLSPVWMQAEGRPAALWWPMLERLNLAFLDLECLELL